MAHKFRAIHPQMWKDKRIKKMTIGSCLVLSYLMTNHHTNGVGYYHIPIEYISADLPVTLTYKCTLECLKELEENKFILYGYESSSVMLLEWFNHNSIGSIKNAKHFMDLHSRKDLPQNEPEMDIVLFQNMYKACEKKESKDDSLVPFFNFIERNIEALKPGGFTDLMDDYGPPFFDMHS